MIVYYASFPTKSRMYYYPEYIRVALGMENGTPSYTRGEYIFIYHNIHLKMAYKCFHVWHSYILSENFIFQLKILGRNTWDLFF